VSYTVNWIPDFLELEGYSYRLSFDWIRRESSSWLARNLPLENYKSARSPHARRIEPNEVRTSANIGNLFTWLVMQRKPEIVVEFGSAFGTSGMYWLSGLEATGSGRLLTFEPNHDWAMVARDNLSAIGSRFELTERVFEDNVHAVVGDVPCIDIGFIDAVHTSAFVLPQFELVLQRLRPGGLVLFDDIDFTEDMAACWRRLAHDRRVLAAVAVAGHVGIVEMKKTA
jgi:predicted O-methyltransferase YrrM